MLRKQGGLPESGLSQASFQTMDADAMHMVFRSSEALALAREPGGLSAGGLSQALHSPWFQFSTIDAERTPSGCRFSEALELSRQHGGLPAGGLSQALHSPPAPGAPLSASWEGTRSNWASSGWGGTLGGLPAGSGGALRPHAGI